MTDSVKAVAEELDVLGSDSKCIPCGLTNSFTLT